MATMATMARATLLASSTLLLLAACGTSPQGYGLMAERNTAAQAQEQLQAAEQATQVDTAQTYLDLIAQMQQAGQWYASLAHTDAFDQEHGARPESQILRADALRSTGQFAAAQLHYLSLLGTANTSTRLQARARHGLGLLHASQGQYTQALEQLEQARRLHPIDPNILSDIAYAYMLNGYLETARIPVQQAAQLAPGNARVQLNLALYWLAAGEPAQAHRLLQRLAQPAAPNTPPLVPNASAAMLQPQLALIQKAVADRLYAQSLATSLRTRAQTAPAPAASAPSVQSTSATPAAARPTTSEDTGTGTNPATSAPPPAPPPAPTVETPPSVTRSSMPSHPPAQAVRADADDSNHYRN
ncbi:Tetratricopeptide repeat-containing protein [Lampropedia hyalina DSM 16112]|uniref:Tetratricopeptide repeat-containing protein n=2 Tax=Lampropedia TaxID=198705 RepID=A0A1M4VC56_9BURK|nr:Tetratricopeptide repeat-containing protein [Lampropedia hyalina DSM 16112]